MTTATPTQPDRRATASAANTHVAYTHRQTHKHIQTDRWTDRQTEAEILIDRQRERHVDGQTER